MITTDTRYQLNAQTKQTSLQRNKDEGKKMAADNITERYLLRL